MKENVLNKAYVYKISIFISGFLPLWLTRSISRCIAFISYLFLKNMRKNVEKNLSHIYDDPKEIKNVTRKIFLNYGSYLADWAKLNHMNTKKVLDLLNVIKGKETIEEGLRRGKGIILLTAHLGNWELGSLFFSHSGIPMNVITAQDAVEGIANVREKTRQSHNVKTITIGKAPLSFMDIVQALQKNEVVAMLMDRYIAEKGIVIDFFGKPARFPIGPVLIAKNTGAAIIPAFIVLGPDGKYKAIADSIVDMEFNGDKETDIRINLKKIVRIFEKYIREYADQWYNFTYLWDMPDIKGREQ